jgi:hypothetical protein
MSPRQSKSSIKRRLSRGDRITPDVRAIIEELERFLSILDTNGRPVFTASCGVYAFYDYDGEPIYVGQTYEGLRVRIRRHLTNQRTDAVAMHVLDPLEVGRVEVWPLWELEGATKSAKRLVLAKAEYTVFRKLSDEARISRLLNEKVPVPTEEIDLPGSYAADIVPDSIRDRLAHADERIARRAGTIANLAQVIRERDVSVGLRQTLVTQAERLEHLARRRLEEVAGATPDRQLEEQVRRVGPED